MLHKLEQKLEKDNLKLEVRVTNDDLKMAKKV